MGTGVNAREALHERRSGAAGFDKTTAVLVQLGRDLAPSSKF